MTTTAPTYTTEFGDKATAHVVPIARVQHQLDDAFIFPSPKGAKGMRSVPNEAAVRLKEIIKTYDTTWIALTASEQLLHGVVVLGVVFMLVNTVLNLYGAFAYTDGPWGAFWCLNALATVCIVFLVIPCAACYVFGTRVLSQARDDERFQGAALHAPLHERAHALWSDPRRQAMTDQRARLCNGDWVFASPVEPLICWRHVVDMDDLYAEFAKSEAFVAANEDEQVRALVLRALYEILDRARAEKD